MLEEKAAEALAHVLKAERIMEELGDTKYQLSGMISAEMRHDLGKEVSKLLGELAEITRQRNALADALEMVRDADEDCHKDGLPTIAESTHPESKTTDHE
jgi:hypothetical protein